MAGKKHDSPLEYWCSTWKAGSVPVQCWVCSSG